MSRSSFESIEAAKFSMHRSSWTRIYSRSERRFHDGAGKGYDRAWSDCGAHDRVSFDFPSPQSVGRCWHGWFRVAVHRSDGEVHKESCLGGIATTARREAI